MGDAENWWEESIVLFVALELDERVATIEAEMGLDCSVHKDHDQRYFERLTARDGIFEPDQMYV